MKLRRTQKTFSGKEGNVYGKSTKHKSGRENKKIRRA